MALMVVFMSCSADRAQARTARSAAWSNTKTPPPEAVTARVTLALAEAKGTAWATSRAKSLRSFREKCQALVMLDTEIAVFNHLAKQDRHFHKRGTEIYIVAEGTMVMEVEGSWVTLHAGDMIIVNPSSVHKVERASEFLCHVITVDCGGSGDKYTAE